MRGFTLKALVITLATAFSLPAAHAAHGHKHGRAAVASKKVAKEEREHRKRQIALSRDEQPHGKRKGYQRVGSTPREFAQFLAEDFQHKGRVIKQTGIKAD